MSVVSRRTLLAGFAATPVISSLSGLATAAETKPSGPAIFADGKYVLPPLPYAYNALEPAIDEQTMHLHHDIHHKAYVDGLNKALDALAEARSKNDFALVKHWEREMAFHASGHFLHSIFWSNMASGGPREPSGALADALKSDFGGFDAFKAHFGAAAKAVEGAGWGILAYDPYSRRLLVSQAEKHQNQAEWGAIPLLVLDVWEHAYYLKYQNKRPAYVDAWWSVVNWPDVGRRYDMHQNLMKPADSQ